MRLASKKFWQLASVASVLMLAVPATPEARASKRANELSLAGLRPGHDRLESPQKNFRELDRDESVTDALLWGDVCTHRELRVEVDSNKIVQTITVDNNYKPEIMAKCLAIVMAPERLKLLASGRGLQLADPCSRIPDLYGKPESQSPSVRGSEQLELWFYSFDWAGSAVPQVMEVSCSASSKRVVAITLAASSL
ncbi:MAG: hypothetical protein ABSB66_02015 [Candidatus Acidiferrales bacterium]